MALELRLIGEVAVLRDGERLPLPNSQKTRALLAYLAVTGKEQRRERLCSLLWNVPDDPKGALRWSLSKLRQLVDDEDRIRLVSNRDSVGLACDDLSIDIALLERARSSDSLEMLEAAANSDGVFAADIDLRGCEEFETWLLAMRENLRQAQVAVWRRLTELYQDQPERALPHARRLIDRDPLDESLWLGLIDLLVRSNRADEAEHQRQLAIRTLEGAAIPVPSGLLAKIPSQMIGPRLAIGRQQRIEYCKATDGTAIAFSRVGTGPPLVKTANWLNHLEYEWESPIWRHWIEDLGRDHTLIRYDERGNGLSDWKVKKLDFESFVEDLELVVDAAGLDQFDLMGISQGCAVSIAYATRHPERVRSMILHGGYCKGWLKREGFDMAVREALYTLARSGWGQDNQAFRQFFTSMFFPEATSEQTRWFNELQRVSASPEGAIRIGRACDEIDVRELLAQITVPTLVTHGRGDVIVPFELGRQLAKGIPNAQFFAFDSVNHLVLEDEPAWPKLIKAIREFLENPGQG